MVNDCLGCVFAFAVLCVHVGVPCDKRGVYDFRDPVPQFVLTCHFRTPRKRKVFRCFVVVFPFPQISHCCYSHASNVVGYVSWLMCLILLAASWISCCACLSARWLRKCSHDRSEPVIHSWV